MSKKSTLARKIKKKLNNHKEFNLLEIKEILKNISSTSKIYIGCDSIVLKKLKKAKYATVIIIHKECKHGASIFGKIEYELVNDYTQSKPYDRMMTEAQKIIDMYNLIEEELIDKEFEIHLDINPNENFGSNVAYNAAKGYIRSLIGVDPIFKPDAFAASYAADKFCR